MAKKTKAKPLDEYARISRDIREQNTTPIYLLDGEESYFIDALTQQLSEGVIDPESQEYSLFTYYGKDIDHADLISACHQSSFFSPQIMVVVREAQELKNFKNLENYFARPNPNCTLVLAYKGKKIDTRTKAYKTLVKNGTYFNSRKLYDNETKSWLQSYVKDSKLNIDALELELLYTYLGNDLHKLANEINKLKLNLNEGDTITSEDIEKYIGISKDYNVYAITKAIGDRNSTELYRMLSHFRANPKSAPLMVVLNILTNFYLQILQYHSHKSKQDYEIASILKINPYFVKDYQKAARSIDPNKARMSLALIYDYNKKAVGIHSTALSEDLLTELLIRLFHA